MKGVEKIAIAAIQDNKLFLVRIGDVWDLPQVRQGNWLTEERAIGGRIQKEIGCPVTIRERVGDFQIDVKRDEDTSHLSVFLADLSGGPIFIRDTGILEWRYVTNLEAKDLRLAELTREKVIPYLIRQRLLIWPKQ